MDQLSRIPKDLIDIIFEYLDKIALYNLKLTNSTFYKLVNSFKNRKLKIIYLFESPAHFYAGFILSNSRFELYLNIKNLYSCLQSYCNEEIVIGLISLLNADLIPKRFEPYIRYEGDKYIKLYLDNYQKEYDLHIILKLLDIKYESRELIYFSKLIKLLKPYYKIYNVYMQSYRNKKGRIIMEFYHVLFDIGAFDSQLHFKGEYPFLYKAIKRKYGKPLYFSNDNYIDKVYGLNWKDLAIKSSDLG